jgi:hypothetical protein
MHLHKYERANQHCKVLQRRSQRLARFTCKKNDDQRQDERYSSSQPTNNTERFLSSSLPSITQIGAFTCSKEAAQQRYLDEYQRIDPMIPPPTSIWRPDTSITKIRHSSWKGVCRGASHTTLNFNKNYTQHIDVTLIIYLMRLISSVSPFQPSFGMLKFRPQLGKTRMRASYPHSSGAISCA